LTIDWEFISITQEYLEYRKDSRYKKFGIKDILMKTIKDLVHEAVVFATQKHAGTNRKSTNLPYITHPLEEMQILIAEGCSEEVIVAGILHDTLEDTETTKKEILELFGKNILKIVTAESEDKSKTWKERKQTTIDNLPEEALEVKLVCCADKLSNLRAMAADKKTIGDKLWERFNAEKSDIAWYYHGIVAAMPDLGDYRMYAELKGLLGEVFG
jgi:(p)ppGpp synthase/HD superfamily hydrolase